MEHRRHDDQHPAQRLRSACLFALQRLVRADHQRGPGQRHQRFLELLANDSGQQEHDRKHATSTRCYPKQTFIRLKRNKLQGEQGSALAITMITCTILATLVGSYYVMIETQNRSVGRSQTWNQAMTV